MNTVMKGVCIVAGAAAVGAVGVYAHRRYKRFREVQALIKPLQGKPGLHEIPGGLAANATTITDALGMPPPGESASQENE